MRAVREIRCLLPRAIGRRTVLLLDALREEESIYETVYSVGTPIGSKCRAYWHGTAPHVPHWNVVYPDELGMTYTRDEITKLVSFYSEQGCTGHVLDGISFLSPDLVDSGGYFFSKNKTRNVLSLQLNQIKFLSTKNLPRFCGTVKEVFDFPDEFVNDFISQLMSLNNVHESRFLLGMENGSPVCCLSTFKSRSGFDFIMNAGTRASHRGKGILRALMSFCMASTSAPLLIRTSNPTLAHRTLPALGFQLVGQVGIARLESLLG